MNEIVFDMTNLDAEIAMRVRYRALTTEELLALRKGMTENCASTMTTIEREAFATHERALTALTTIRAILKERGVE